MKRPLRIANASGFLGDRGAAWTELVAGEPVDVISGDYLAELTLWILAKQRRRDAKLGYAGTFLHHLEPVLGAVAERKIKVVVNAGGLNPRGLAEAVRTLCGKVGVKANVAAVLGDEVTGELDALEARGILLESLESGEALGGQKGRVQTANAYLGARGIAMALERGADIVIAPRVTDASLTVGPAAWWHGWTWDAWDALAGAVVAGHVIECGTQATGGNYSSFLEAGDLTHPGFPIAEVAADGSSVITKNRGTGGKVSVGTVTAQLVYEIQSTRYLNPDVTTKLETIQLVDLGEDRVEIRGTKGFAPPSTTKVAITLAGGFRNELTFVLTGLDVEAKAALLENAVRKSLEGQPLTLVFQRIGSADPEARTQNEASTLVRVLATSESEAAAGRAFSGKLIELALGNYPGLYATDVPGGASEVGKYWPALIPQEALRHRVLLEDGTELEVPLPPEWGEGEDVGVGGGSEGLQFDASTMRVAIGELVDARSGDKGSNANLGVWTRTEVAYAWLRDELTAETLVQWMPELKGHRVERFELPNLRALNFVIHGLMDGGALATERYDRQAKALGEFFRSRRVEVPEVLLRGR